jgi:hypothetical protein
MTILPIGRFHLARQYWAFQRLLICHAAVSPFQREQKNTWESAPIAKIVIFKIAPVFI